jgi:hypothetical protein
MAPFDKAARKYELQLFTLTLEDVEGIIHSVIFLL